MPVFTITRPGDTWDAIARDHIGHNYTRHDLQDLITANEPSIYYWNLRYQLSGARRLEPHSELPEYRALCLPQNYRSFTSHSESLLRLLDSMPVTSRRRLSCLERAGISPHYAVAAANVAQQVWRESKKPEQDSAVPEWAKYGIGSAITAYEKASELGKEDIEAIIKTLKSLEAKLKPWGRSGGAAFKEDVQHAYTQAAQALNKSIGKWAVQRTPYLMETQDKLLRQSRKAGILGRGIVIISEENLWQIRQMLEFFKWAPAASWGADLSIAGISVMMAFDNHENVGHAALEAGVDIFGWRTGSKFGLYAFKEVLPELASRAIPAIMESSIAGDTSLALIGVAAGMAMAPEWLIVLGGVALGATAAYFSSKLLEGIEKIYEEYRF